MHRDLKPHNIFLMELPDEGFFWVKIGDFGLARREITEKHNQLKKEELDFRHFTSIHKGDVNNALTLSM